MGTDIDAARSAGLYPYQERDLNILFEKITHSPKGNRILYQLPTGGGKTRIFSEMAKWFITTFHQQVMVLTHRTELCKQTAATLKRLGIKNKVINSTVKRLSPQEDYPCYVGMVETLRNRLRQGMLDISGIGLLIIDEAHHHSFQKLLKRFPHALVVGVTATPLSSNVEQPMNKTYHELVVGESIAGLIQQGYLAKPVCRRYDVELHSLKTGSYGDFTISTSDELYSSPAMLDLLLHVYETHAKQKKTLIFNNGIFTSRNVCRMFEDAGYPVKHLDHHHSAAERADILKWFKRTKGAILSSVSILTTGFDEPSIQTVILNRATTSLTLYHQMIGRGSRSLPKKKTFSIIDLGNNTDRFGDWHAPLDWQLIFDRPELFHETMRSHAAQEARVISPDLRSKFPNTLQLSFDIQEAYHRVLAEGQKPLTVIRDAIRQHARMCIENSTSIAEALQLADVLDNEISWRVKQYGKCLGKVTKNYTDWLKEDYKSRLKLLIQKLMKKSIAGSKRSAKAA